MTRHGVPICAHIGLTPQTVHKLGGYKVQGRDDSDSQSRCYQMLWHYKMQVQMR